MTRKVGGTTVIRAVRPDAVEQTRNQVSEYQRFRRLSREFFEVSEALCEARLRTGRRTQKKGSKKR